MCRNITESLRDARSPIDGRCASKMMVGFLRANRLIHAVVVCYSQCVDRSSKSIAACRWERFPSDVARQACASQHLSDCFRFATCVCLSACDSGRLGSTRCCVDRRSELVEPANRSRVARKSVARRLQNRLTSALQSSLRRPKNRCPEGSGASLEASWAVLLPKIIQKSTPKLPKSSPKPSRIHPKTSQNPPKNASKTRSGGDCASDRFWAFFSLGSVGVLGRLGRLLGPSWSRLGASGGVLEPSWHDLGAVLGRPWGVLGRLGASWGRLGGVLDHLGGVLGKIPRKTLVSD